MSFNDVGRRASAPYDVKRTSVQKVRSSSRKSRARDPPPRDDLNPKLAFDQISEALKHHEQDRNVMKERSLITHSTTVPRYSSSSTLSVFSRLNDEIVQFQKMVNELYSIVESDVMTPEDQWRTRILLQSADNAASDLEVSIDQSPWNQKDLTVKASFSKLKRDFERARKIHRSAVEQYHRKQSAEAALLFSKNSERPPRVRNRDRSKQRGLVTEEKEDYFERAMRERENETMEINAKIHVVEDIYRELGRLVGEQQEKVDIVEDQIRFARADTEVGIENLEKANIGMCGLGVENASRSRREQPPQVISMEELSWKLPFQTFQQDILEVRNDLVDLVHVSARKIRKMGNGEIFRCGNSTAFENFPDSDGIDSEVVVENNRRSMIM